MDRCVGRQAERSNTDGLSVRAGGQFLGAGGSSAVAGVGSAPGRGFVFSGLDSAPNGVHRTLAGATNGCLCGESRATQMSRGVLWTIKGGASRCKQAEKRETGLEQSVFYGVLRLWQAVRIFTHLLGSNRLMQQQGSVRAPCSPRALHRQPRPRARPRLGPALTPEPTLLAVRVASSLPFIPFPHLALQSRNRARSGGPS
jgi:hypothetical protein